MAEELRREPVFAVARVTIGERDDEGREAMIVRLAPGESQAIRLTLELAEEIEGDKFAAYELTQRTDARDGAVGAVGIAIRQP